MPARGPRGSFYGVIGAGFARFYGVLTELPMPAWGIRGSADAAQTQRSRGAAQPQRSRGAATVPLDCSRNASAAQLHCSCRAAAAQPQRYGSAAAAKPLRCSS
eukprot:gene16390-biopygen11865